MKLRIAFLVTTLFLGFSSASFSQSYGWKDKNNCPATDTASRRSVDGFGGMMIITPDVDWEEKWNTPSGTSPFYKKVNEAKVGETIYILSFFSNPKSNPLHVVNISCDIQIIQPDGTVAMTEKNRPCFHGVLGGAPEMIYMTNAAVGFMGEEKDPKGVWTVKLAMKDQLRTEPVMLTQSFTLK